MSGGDKGARSASLSIMAGGPSAVVQALQPLFACMGTCHYMGEAGTGQSCKMANQVMSARCDSASQRVNAQQWRHPGKGRVMS